MTKECPIANEQSVVSGQWSVAFTTRMRRFLGVGHWPLVIGHSLVIGQWSLAILLTGCTRPSNDTSTLESQLFAEVQVIGTRGTAPGQFNKPRSVALDTNDNLFVVDMTGRVQKFSPAGLFLSSWQMPETDKGKPKGMCRDAEGNIVVIEPHYSRVNHFTSDGQLVRQWGRHG